VKEIGRPALGGPARSATRRGVGVKTEREWVVDRFAGLGREPGAITIDWAPEPTECR